MLQSLLCHEIHKDFDLLVKPISHRRQRAVLCRYLVLDLMLLTQAVSLIVFIHKCIGVVKGYEVLTCCTTHNMDHHFSGFLERILCHLSRLV